MVFFFFFKQKTAYEMRISDWSSDVCSSDLRCYRCADGRDIAVGAVEQQFYRQLLELIGAPATLLESQNDHARWPADSEILAGIFAGRSRDDWCTLLQDRKSTRLNSSH